MARAATSLLLLTATLPTYSALIPIDALTAAIEGTSTSTTFRSNLFPHQKRRHSLIVGRQLILLAYKYGQTPEIKTVIIRIISSTRESCGVRPATFSNISILL